MKSASGRTLLLVIGILLLSWGVLPRQSTPAAAAPQMLVTETATGEPPTRTPTPVPATPTTPPTEAPTVTTPPAEVPTSPPADDRATSTPTATPTLTPEPTILADPAVSKSVNPQVAVVGDTVTYTIVATNIGGSVATGVVVEDTLPSILAVGEVTADRGEVTVSGNTVRVVIGDLAPGETVTIRISAQLIAAPVPPNNANLAVISSESPDADLNNNQASVTLSGPPPVTLPSTSAAGTGLLPVLATVLGLALIGASLLMRRSPRR